MLHSSTRTRLIFIMTLLLLTFAPYSARARVGDRLEDAKRTDFFRFFNLVEAGMTGPQQQRKVFVFRPRAGMLVFLWERHLSEQRLKQRLVRLQNSKAGGDGVLTIRVDGTVQPAKKTKRTKDERK